MPRRVKVPVQPPPATREEMERLVGDICALVIFRDQTVALMNQRLMEIRAEYEVQLADAAKNLNQMLARAKAWADAHPEEFGPRKSIEMTHGTVGFRTGQPTLKPLKGWTWAKILPLLKECYIRTRREPDKEALLAARRDIGAAGFREVGLRIDQAETFFVEPKRDTAPGSEVA